MAFQGVSAKLDKQATENDPENKADAPIYRYHYLLSPQPPREWYYFFDLARAQRPQERAWVAPYTIAEDYLIIYCPPLQQKFKDVHDHVIEDVALANQRLKDQISQTEKTEDVSQQGVNDLRAVKERLAVSWALLRAEDFR